MFAVCCISSVYHTHTRYILKQGSNHDDVIKWKRISRYLPFVRGIHRSPVNSPHKCQWRGASMFSLICAWINGWVNNGEAGDLSRHLAHYDVTVMMNIFLTPLDTSCIRTNHFLTVNEKTIIQHISVECAPMATTLWKHVNHIVNISTTRKSMIVNESYWAS